MYQPRIVIAGKPNVGKSTLFNRILRKRAAIVHPQAGITRDRKTASAMIGAHSCRVTDTGGLYASEDDVFAGAIKQQVAFALEDADLVILVVDASEISGADQEISELLRKSGRPVWVLANKIDRMGGNTGMLSEVYRLGFDRVIGVSAEHGTNVTNFIEMLTQQVAELVADHPSTAGADENLDKDLIRVALIGRPNVGKSSLLNALLNDERSIVSDIPGTTRDSVEERFSFNNRNFMLVDTAGLRRKSKVRQDIEFYSNVRAKASIQDSHITILLIEPQTLITDQDKKICDIVTEEGKGLIFAINKWDTVDHASKQLLREIEDKIRFQFPALQHAPIIPISAHNGHGINKLLSKTLEVHKHLSFQLSTPDMNKFVESELRSYVPTKKGKSLRIYYALQTGNFPPRFVFFVNDAAICTNQFKSYLVNKLRAHFSFEGAPIFISFRDKKND